VRLAIAAGEHEFTARTLADRQVAATLDQVEFELDVQVFKRLFRDLGGVEREHRASRWVREQHSSIFATQHQGRAGLAKGIPQGVGQGGRIKRTIGHR
jgi:hypothetical protein